ncbi:MAG: NAD(P)-dependent oxidoreductase [Candidatus Promineifilaceae bacterium]|nr:NAD(P)-dependent oxidoreductase [Candidatus Promineifilaceae bacterium]
MSSHPRVLILDPVPEEALEILRQVAEVALRPDLTRQEIQAVVGDYHGLLVGPRTRLTHDIIEEGLNLRVIGSAGTRLDNIDVTTARSMGIKIQNSPGSTSIKIAEHTLRLMLQLAMRRVGGMRAGGGLSGKKLGIIGFGATGREVARRALAFDMRIVANQPRLTPELALDEGVRASDLLDVLHEADFVTLHVPFREEARVLIGPEELAHMRPDAYLINTGHTDLVDDAALLAALNQGQLAGAAIPAYPEAIAGPPDEPSRVVRKHPKVLVAPHITSLLGDTERDAAVAVAKRMAEVLKEKRPAETLSLDVVPVEQVVPHEQIDEKRVARLAERLKDEQKLINPPIVTFWEGKYVILDGATRFTALKRLGYPHLIVQVVTAERDDFELHTWYHAISGARPAEELFELLEDLEGLRMEVAGADRAQAELDAGDALCYFLEREGGARLVRSSGTVEALEVMNRVVNTYNEWGNVERTLLTDLSRLRGQFPEMQALAIFPQFAPAEVFQAASEGRLLPAGLTRFIIPGRVLRLNADLKRLKADEPLASKRAWFNQFVAAKLARSRLRYYEEPVVLLDE